MLGGGGGGGSFFLNWGKNVTLIWGADFVTFPLSSYPGL